MSKQQKQYFGREFLHGNNLTFDEWEKQYSTKFGQEIGMFDRFVNIRKDNGEVSEEKLFYSFSKL